MYKKLFVVALLAIMSWCYAEARDYITLSGNIGPYTIVMKLDPTADSGTNCGYYYYTDKKHRRRVNFKLVMGKYDQINLHGSVKMTLYEFSPSGSNTGTFRGQLECSVGSYSGTFTNRKGKKYHFSLY